MTTISRHNCRKLAIFVTLAASLAGGCASNPTAEAPAMEGEPGSATTGQPAGSSAAMTYHPPAGVPTDSAVAPVVQPAALSVPPPPLAKGYVDKSATASYLTTEEYQEALEYQAALERYLTDPFIVANHLATERLLRDSQVDVASYGRLAVAPFTDLDRPGKSAHLGRMIGGQIASRLTQLGYPVVEVDGAAREAGGVGSSDRARAVIVGQYAISQDRIFVTARLIDTAVDNQVVSAVDYALPLDQTTLGLVTGCFRQGQWVCRMP